MSTCTKPTPNPRGHRPLEGVGTRMGWLAHALPTRAKSGRGKGVSGRGATQPSPLIPDHAGLRPRLNQPRTAMAYRVRNGPQLGAVPAPTSGPRVCETPKLPTEGTPHG